MKKINLVYFGTPNFSAQFLEKLLTDTLMSRLIGVKLVVTQPDKPVGKKQTLTKSAVREAAEKYHITVAVGDAGGGVPDTRAGNEHWRGGEPWQNLLQQIDLALVCAYGKIIPKAILNIPKYGFWNIHFSLLPKYRGAAPLAYSLLLGDKKAGVTIFQMDEKIDHGPIIAQEEMKISPTDKRSDLETKLNNLAFKMFKQLITGVEVAGLPTVPILSGGGKPRQAQLLIQNNKQATYTRHLTKSDGLIPFSTLKKALKNEPLTPEELPKIIREYYLKNHKSQMTNNKSISNFKVQISNSSETVFNLFRGLSPWPGVWTVIKINGVDKRLKITNLTIAQYNNLTIESVQLEGKKEVDFKTFNEAYKIF